MIFWINKRERECSRMDMSMLEAGMVTIVSMGIVFLVLTVLWGALELLHKLVAGRGQSDG